MRKLIILMRDLYRLIIPARHDFNMSRILEDKITTTRAHSLSGKKTVKDWVVYGFQCDKCGKILWLDKSDMSNLPKSMKYGCGK